MTGFICHFLWGSISLGREKEGSNLALATAFVNSYFLVVFVAAAAASHLPHSNYLFILIFISLFFHFFFWCLSQSIYRATPLHALGLAWPYALVDFMFVFIMSFGFKRKWNHLSLDIYLWIFRIFANVARFLLNITCVACDGVSWSYEVWFLGIGKF